MPIHTRHRFRSAKNASSWFRACGSARSRVVTGALTTCRLRRVSKATTSKPDLRSAAERPADPAKSSRASRRLAGSRPAPGGAAATTGPLSGAATAAAKPGRSCPRAA
eukprot:10448043-Lingulodinium_polyedra.AAC.1